MDEGIDMAALPDVEGPGGSEPERGRPLLAFALPFVLCDEELAYMLR